MKKSLLVKSKLIYTGITIFLVVLVILLSHGAHIIRSRQPWIKAGINILIRDGKPFRFIGASAVNTVFYDNWGLDVEKVIRTAKENNISVLRFYIDWGWSKDEDIDNILNIASRHGIYVILTLTDCCCSGDYSSLKKYFEVHAPFCNIENPHSRYAFKKRIKEVIGRRNPLNGRLYRDDPTILAWEIANELEYWHFSEHDVYQWVNDMATYIKTLDGNHLVTIGINAGNAGLGDDNPVYKIYNVPALDFFSFHLYPSAEETGQIEFIAKKFLSLGKPVIMGEFGVGTGRDPLDALAFKKCMDTAFYAGCSAVMFWGWGIPEEKKIPMWWSQESYSIADKEFCVFIKKYQIPKK